MHGKAGNHGTQDNRRHDSNAHDQRDDDIDLPGAPGTPRNDYLGEINTGYGNRPYKGNTGFLRLLYQF